MTRYSLAIVLAICFSSPRFRQESLLRNAHTTTEIKVPQLRPWQTTALLRLTAHQLSVHAALLLITESIRSGRTAECSTKPEHQASIDIIGCRCHAAFAAHSAHGARCAGRSLGLKML